MMAKVNALPALPVPLVLRGAFQGGCSPLRGRSCAVGGRCCRHVSRRKNETVSAVLAFGYAVLCCIRRVQAIRVAFGDFLWDRRISRLAPVDTTRSRGCAGHDEFEPQRSESLVDNRCHSAEYFYGVHWYLPFISRLKPRCN
jgi:hypothetical protein